MATIKPFAALRPKPELAPQICELPYDVMSTAEAREMARNNPLSFLHVSKPEIDLPPETSPYDESVYAKGSENFQALIKQGALRQDEKRHFYLYRQIMGNHTQLGLVAVASCQDYLKDRIKKHELTRPEKEDDRVRHMESLHAQTGPVFLTYPAQPDLDALFATLTSPPAEVDWTAPDGVRHSAWTVQEEDKCAEIESLFEKVPCLYIADGHHRSAAAARVFASKQGAGASGWFLTVVFPHNQMQILPYNRALKTLNDHTPESLWQALDAVFVLQQEGSPSPSKKHQLGFYFQNQWWSLTFRPKFAATTDPIEKLDVTLLQKYVLDPIFGIENPRTSDQIAFVGGIRGTGELEKLVRSGAYACAFSMFPTSIEDLMTISDAGGLMPPKSTWFEPKLRDGLFSHLI